MPITGRSVRREKASAVARTLISFLLVIVGAASAFTAPPAFGRMLTASCSAAEFGARGDDNADDRAALQMAIDQCAVVHVPAGRYLVSPQGAAAFDLDVPAGRSIIGTDRDTTTLVQTVAGPSVRLLQVSGAGVTISGLTLDGSKAVQTADEHRAGVFATGAPDLVLRNVKAQNFTGDGFYIYNGSNDPTLENVIGIDNDRNGITFGGGTTGGSVTASTFSGNTAQQLDSEPGLGTAVNGLTVTDSRFDASNDYAVTMSGASDAQSTGWTVKNNIINGGVFAVWLANSEISGNRGTNSSTKPCYSVYRRSDHITISGNECVQTQMTQDSVAGVLVQGTGPDSMPTNITIATNRITVTGRATSFGVRAEGVASVSIVGNTLIGPGQPALGYAGIYVRSTIIGSPLKSAIVDANNVWNWADSAFRLTGNTTPTGSALIEALEFNDNVLGDTSSPLVQLHAVTIDANAVPLRQTRSGNSCVAPMPCEDANLTTSAVPADPASGPPPTITANGAPPLTKSATSTTLKLAATRIKVNKPTRATVTVKTAGTTLPINGKVTIKAAGKTVGIGTVKNGHATVTIKRFTKKGIYKLRATLTGTAFFSASTSKAVKLQVTK